MTSPRPRRPTRLTRAMRPLAALATAWLLTACGGGSGSSSTEALNLNGIAAVGQPIVGGQVQVRCAGGAALSGEPTGSDGSYRVLLQGAQAPCMVAVSGGRVGRAAEAPANTQSLHGYAAVAGTAHATQLTELVLAHALGRAPSQVFAQFGSSGGTTAVAPAALAAASDYLRTQFAAIGLAAPGADPLSGGFAIGDANDRLMDQLAAQLAAADATPAELTAGTASHAPWPPLVTERPCAAAELPWARGEHVCSAAAPATASGQSLTLDDGMAPETGRATFSCGNGRWSAPTAASCDPPPSPCAAGPAHWNVDGHACEAVLAESPSGGTQTLEDLSEPSTGRATFSCSNGQWSAPVAAACTTRAVSCPAQPASWRVGGNRCDAELPVGAAGATATVTDGLGDTLGSASYSCSNGSWSGPSHASCTVPATCPAQTLNWTAGGQACSAAVAATPSGRSATASDTTLPTLGSASFPCSNGSWGVASSASCTAPPQGPRTVRLGLNADPTGRWYEYFSDAFAEIGRPWNGSQVMDGFFLISALPASTVIGSGQDVFPQEGDWGNVGSLTYNLDGYTGSGTFNAPITALAMNLAPYVAENASVLNMPYTTTVTAVSGAVTLTNGAVTAIVLNASIAFGWADTPFGPLNFPGTFVITSDGRFTLRAGLGGAIGTPAAGWDFSGTVKLP
ncbi:MAG: hypothetical protein QM788_13470 [Roseateles sp.]|uniref:hypothetical protein n=1 Tax=Roseateles sp. TaxID=1971397 RepID=UPI0039EC3173